MAGLFGSQAKASAQPPAAGALNIQQSSFGVPITLVYGTNRITGNLIWYGDFTATQQSNSGGGGGGKGGGGGGGKGGGGGSYNYSASYMIGLCEGPIEGIGQVWESKSVTTLSSLSGALFEGAAGQAPWGYLAANHSAQSLGYSGLAYVTFANTSLGSTPDTPNYAFEVQGLLLAVGQDAYADQVILDFLLRAQFPAANIGNFTAAAAYWTASGFFISPVVDQQRTATDYLTEWMTTLNAEFLWSGGKLSIVSYADAAVTGNGASYVPSLTPVYDLADDDFIRDGDTDPVTATRADLADAHNQQPIEYDDRTNHYNLSTYTAEDGGHIDQFGLRPASTVTAHHVTLAATAQQMAQNILTRNLWVRNTYQFKLGWKYFLLDPMDYVTITDVALGLNNALVRITEIDEDENGLLTVTAEDVPGGIAAPALYTSQSPTRFTPNLQTPCGNANAPIIFEPPLALIQSAQVQVWLAISGLAPWGGCDIWTSTDGATYSFLERFIGNARQGVLSTALPSAASPDTTNTLAVNFTMSGSTIGNTPTVNDATALNTLSYVDGELIAYGGAALTGTNKYSMTYLIRGAYGSTIGTHAAGANFARLDQQIVELTIDQSRIGQKLYVKLVGFNVFGGGQQDIAQVPAYAYIVTGAALLAPLANPSNLAVNYSDKIAQLTWTGVSDLRAPILYEIRQGASFANAPVVTRTTNTWIPVQGSGTYWVSALYFTPLGVAVYSSTPPSIAVTAPSLIDNILATYDEAAAGFKGTCSAGCLAVGGNVVLQGTGNVLADTNILAEGSILFLGGVASNGVYTAAASSTLVSASVVNAKVTVNWVCYAQSILDNILTNQNVLVDSDLLSQRFQSLVYAQPQIRLSQDGVNWSAWQNWQPGVYTFLQAQLQILLYSADPNVQAVLSAFSFEADVASRTAQGTSTSSASADTIVTYPSTFNAIPLPQITIQNAQAGDDVILTAQTATGFTYRILNAGARVVRTINYASQAF